MVQLCNLYNIIRIYIRILWSLYAKKCAYTHCFIDIMITDAMFFFYNFHAIDSIFLIKKSNFPIERGHFHLGKARWCNYTDMPHFLFRYFVFILFCFYLHLHTSYANFICFRIIMKEMELLVWSTKIVIITINIKKRTCINYRMADSACNGPSNSSPQVEKGWPALKQHITENKVKFGLWMTRLFTIIFTIGYIIPIFG